MRQWLMFSREARWHSAQPRAKQGDFQQGPQPVFQEGVWQWHLLLAGGEEGTPHCLGEHSSGSRHALPLGISASVDL